MSEWSDDWRQRARESLIMEAGNLPEGMARQGDKAQSTDVTVTMYVVQNKTRRGAWLDGPSEWYPTPDEAWERVDEIAGWDHVAASRVVERTVRVTEQLALRPLQL